MTAREVHAEIVTAHNKLAQQVHDAQQEGKDDSQIPLTGAAGVRILEMMAKLASEIVFLSESTHT